ncbi:MAG: DUF1007 family protein [Hyphomicrobium sp.]|uniref:DUF1007 family protein n=1 Tax=Hyphomicrobium sp. TaxID=82 RepID=UPI0013242785|nr:DUF1007 family protein [Hyphomicrobium sp.]KAB2942498.1 MAG: DUF1007 family protein [Hyphomicrobium sp.]MBZ0208462.1 DUF1007 family protein [Hyphomicrobium sp.]
MRPAKFILAVAAIAAGLSLSASSAGAHPHVWVTMKETVLYDNGTITGLQQAWTFDEIYTQTAIEGLDKNGDGKYDREELKELAQVNIDGLKEFEYFTFAKLGDKTLKFKPPVDYWLDYSDKGILTLHFTLPLEAPVPADAPGFNFAVFDSSYFIAFDFAEADAIKLGANAPASCKPAIHEPPDDSDTQALNDAFSSALGQDAQQPGASGTMSSAGTVSLGSSKTVAIECAKS